MADPYSVDPLLKEIAWGKRYGAFDDRLGRSLLRAWTLGAADEGIRGMILDRVRRLRARAEFGELDPFLIPHLDSGEILLGNAENGREVRIPVQWLAAGLLVAGNTGSGKTNLLTWLMPQVAATGCRVWMSEMYKTQIRHLRPLFQQVGTDLVILRARDWRFNLLQPIGHDPRGHLATAVDTLVRRLDLPPRARAILQQACFDLYDRFSVWAGQSAAYPCLWDLYEWVKSAEGLNPAARESILDRLGALLLALTPECGAYRFGWRATELSNYSIDFEMRGTSEIVKQLLLEPVLNALLRHEIEKGLVNAPISLLVAFEDSQRFFDAQGTAGEITPIDELAGVVRGSGKGLAVVVQSMNGLSRRLVPNLATKIMGRLGSHEDYLRLGGDMAMTREQISHASRRLGPGRFVVHLSEGKHRDPFLISVPEVRIHPTVSDAEARSSASVLDGLKTVPATEFKDWKPDHIIQVVTSRSDRKSPSPVRGRSTGPTVTKEALDYLVSIAENPFLNVTDRDRVLGLAKSKGNRLRKLLEEMGLLKSVPINPGGRGRRFHLLELTRVGVERLSEFNGSVPAGRGRGGLRHQWWVRELASWFKGKALTPVIEDESRGVRVDVAVTTGNGMDLAIEIETSSGHELENIRKDLGAGFEGVVSLVGNHALARRLEETVRQELDSSEVSRVRIGRLKDYQEMLGHLIS